MRSADAQTPALRVELRNDARVAGDGLDLARPYVEEIYARAGVRIVWVPDESQVTVVLKRRPSDDLMHRLQDAMGLTPGGDTERGRLAFVFINRVNAIASGYGAARFVVLGAAIAHELGHLLLSKEHTTSGIMQRYLNQADFRALREGRLLFTEIQAEMLREGVIARSR